MKKMLLALGLLLLCLPITSLMAEELKQLTAENAVDELLEKDLSQHITAANPKLSDSTQPYLMRFGDEMEEIQDTQLEYQDLTSRLAAEMAAYQNVYNYWAAQESLKVAQTALEQAKSELNIVELKREQGLASDSDLIQAQMDVNQAEVNVQNAKQQVNLLKMKLNQGLERDLKQNLVIGGPNFSELPASSYDPEKVAKLMMESHPSLDTLKTTIKVYEDILRKVESMTTIGGNEIRSQIADKREQRDNLAAQIEEIQARLGTVTDPEERSRLEQQKQALEEDLLETRAMLNAYENQLKDMQKDRDRAEKELKEYYRELLDEAKIQLKQQERRIELLSYHYAERFATMAGTLAIHRENVGKVEGLYRLAYETYNQGLLAKSELEKSRLNLDNARLQYINAQKDYLLLKEEFRLFKEGYLPMQ
jgi:hypothetical protein